MLRKGRASFEMKDGLERKRFCVAHMEEEHRWIREEEVFCFALYTKNKSCQNYALKVCNF